MDSVVDQLMSEVEKQYKDYTNLTEDLLSALQFTFGTPLLPALDLVDQRSVSLLRCPAGRTLYQVIGSSGTPYMCPTSTDYCGCPAFRFNVLKKNEYILCKHILAIKLCKAMGVCQEQAVSNQELATALKHMD